MMISSYAAAAEPAFAVPAPVLEVPASTIWITGAVALVLFGVFLVDLVLRARSGRKDWMGPSSLVILASALTLGAASIIFSAAS